MPGALGALRPRRLVAPLAALAALTSAPGVAHAAAFVVTAPVDAVDANVGDGRCAAADGACTLRAAIQEANSAGAASTITVPEGRYRLTIAPTIAAGTAVDMDAGNGDLDLNADIAMRGAGAGRTVIDGGGLDRVFEIGREAETELLDLTVTGGDSTAGGNQEIDLGGGVLNKGAITLERVALVGNTADGGGGMFSIPRTMPVIRDSLIAGNQAFEGGGLRIDSGATIVNTTITANRLLTLPPDGIQRKPVAIVVPTVDEISGYGGGIDHRGGADLTIVNSTITDNRAIKGGGGIGAGQGYVPISGDLPLGHLVLHNTIIAGNGSDSGPANCRTNEVTFRSLGHNIDSDGSCFLSAAGDHPGIDPRLGPLADNSGPTQTQALLAGSAAIDAGDAGGCPEADQRGVARPQGAACDIGAYELTSPRGPAAREGCTFSVRLPARLRRRAVSFDVFVAGRALARRRHPARRVTIRRASRPSRVTLRVRLRGGRTTRVVLHPRCRS